MRRIYSISIAALFLPLFASGASGASKSDSPPEVPLHISSESTENSPTLVEIFCRQIDAQYKNFSWGESRCASVPWSVYGTSEKGHPLIYWTLESTNNAGETSAPKDTTLLIGGVHGDEPSGVYVLFKYAQELLSNPRMVTHHRVIIAPVVNPDGFLSKTRNNANGVDLNRNLPTKDWEKNAHRLWKTRRNGNPQHFPGNQAGTEKGSLFQMHLVNKFDPDKIFSLHSPLSFIDYDGPGSSKKLSARTPAERRASQLAKVFAERTKNTRVANYRFFPGSLGNYAGNERNIPTITVEFASSNPKFATKHWKDVMNAITAGVNFEFQKLTLATSAPEKTN
jgi:protein MpaA